MTDVVKDINIPAPGARGDPDAASLPIIDLKKWYHGQETDKRAVMKQTSDACHTHGMFYLMNHAVPAPLIDDILDSAKRFFALPYENKEKLHYDLFFQRYGYVPSGHESARRGAVHDDKEVLIFSLPTLEAGQTQPRPGQLRIANTWPEELPGLDALVEDYFQKTLGLIAELFAIIAADFGLPDGFFDDKIDHPIAHMRLLHYPPRRQDDDQGPPGTGAHSDLGCITVLAQDDCGGLQIRDDAGNWRDVGAIPRALLVTLGEMLVRWTNGAFRAPMHRVINRSGRDRYSIPFFLAANEDAVLSPLAAERNSGRGGRPPSITAGEFLSQLVEERYGRR